MPLFGSKPPPPGESFPALCDKMARLDAVAVAAEIEYYAHLMGMTPCGGADGCAVAFRGLIEDCYEKAIGLCLIHKVPLTRYFTSKYDDKMKNISS